MIVLEVFFPEDITTTTQGQEPQSSMSLWNGVALSFFLESLWKGSSLFNGRRFRVDAYRVQEDDEGRQWIGRGYYEVVDRQLITHDEAGELINVLGDAWLEMLKRIRQQRK